MPKSARKRSRWPMPSSPPTPRISPDQSANEKSCTPPSMASPSPARDRRRAVPHRLRRPGRKGRGQRAPDHQLDHPVVGDLVRAEAPHHAAVAQDRQAVAEVPHLLHPVRDEDDGRARRAQPLEQRAEPLHVVAGERRGGLVEQQQAGAARDRAGDLDLLLGGERERPHLGVGVDVVEAEVRECAAHLRLRFAPSDAPAEAGGLVGQQHVLHDREVADQGDFLIGGLDAVPVGVARRVDAGGAAEQRNFAGVRPAEAAQHLDQRRLARAVLAEQRMDLAARDGERHVVERDGRAERLAQAADFDRRRLLIHCRLPDAATGRSWRRRGARRSPPRPLRRPGRERPGPLRLPAFRDQLPSGTAPLRAE